MRLPIVTVRTGPSLESRPVSPAGDPIRKRPVGSTTISGPSPPLRSASRNTVPTARSATRRRGVASSAGTGDGADTGAGLSGGEGEKTPFEAPHRPSHKKHTAQTATVMSGEGLSLPLSWSLPLPLSSSGRGGGGFGGTGPGLRRVNTSRRWRGGTDGGGFGGTSPGSGAGLSSSAHKAPTSRGRSRSSTFMHQSIARNNRRSYDPRATSSAGRMSCSASPRVSNNIRFGPSSNAPSLTPVTQRYTVTPNA